MGGVSAGVSSGSLQSEALPNAAGERPQETALKTDRQTQSRKITEAELDTETQEHSTRLQTHRHTHTFPDVGEKEERWGSGERQREKDRHTDIHKE